MRAPVLGQDYLNDWYAILGIPRDSTLEQIRARLHDLTKEYHPDKYASLAAVYREDAERRMKLYADAREVLTDAESRAAYDNKLADWKKPLSTDGTPLISIDDIGFDADALFKTCADEEKIRQEIEGLARQCTGYNPKLFAMAERCAKSDDATNEDRDAYRVALGQRDQYLLVLEGMLWQRIGFPFADADSTPRNYLEETARKISERRQFAESAIATAHLALTDGGAKLALPAPAEASASVAASEEFKVAALERFDRITKDIEALAGDREATINARLEALDYAYVPEQSGRFPRIILRITAGSTVQWMAFRIEGDRIVGDEAFTPESLEALSDPANAAAVISQGVNIIHVTLEQGIGANDQVVALLEQHFDEWDLPE